MASSTVIWSASLFDLPSRLDRLPPPPLFHALSGGFCPLCGIPSSDRRICPYWSADSGRCGFSIFQHGSSGRLCSVSDHGFCPYCCGKDSSGCILRPNTWWTTTSWRTSRCSGSTRYGSPSTATTPSSSSHGEAPHSLRGAQEGEAHAHSRHISRGEGSRRSVVGSLRSRVGGWRPILCRERISPLLIRRPRQRMTGSGGSLWRCRRWRWRGRIRGGGWRERLGGRYYEGQMSNFTEEDAKENQEIEETKVKVTEAAEKDSSFWPIVEPLPSYGRGLELPGGSHRSLIHGQNLIDIVITSDNGTVDGQGSAWWAWSETHKL